MPGLRGVRIAQLGSSDGKTLEARAPLTLCGAAPGTWRVRADAAGFAPAGTTVEVTDGAATRVELPLQPRGELHVAGSGKVTLVEANGRSSERTLPLKLELEPLPAARMALGLS